MTDLGLYEEMVRLARKGEPYVLATVVDNGGSSPRKAGAKMVVRSDGSSFGTVGGGKVESATIEAARMSLVSGTARILDFDLTEENGFVCGGRMTVFIEPQERRPLLVMFGAGHVGRAITLLANGCGFRVAVVDDRSDCAVAGLLPGADEIHCCRAGEACTRLQPDRESFVVIATPGHLTDFEAIRVCLATEARYIGLLGSRRKRAVLQNILTKEGYDAAQKERITSPAGLDIGAQTPEEIAVSIVAQLIAMRRQS